MVDSALHVRPARVTDVAQMARVHVRCWQETFRGLMPDSVLDDPGLVTVRERFWTAALTDEQYRENSALHVRPARVTDVAQMARVHVRCWQETFRGLMPDSVLDDPGLVTVRERFWTAALTDEQYRENRVAVGGRRRARCAVTPALVGRSWKQ